MGRLNRRKINFCKHSEKTLSEWRQPTKRPVGMHRVTEQQEITSCSLSTDTQPCQCKHLVQVITNSSGITAGGRILLLALWNKVSKRQFYLQWKLVDGVDTAQADTPRVRNGCSPGCQSVMLSCRVILNFVFFGFSYLNDDPCFICFLLCHDYPTQLPKYSYPYRKEYEYSLENCLYFRQQ